jgi:hypothetical protein
VSKVDYSNYEGREVVGSPTWVISRGETVGRDGKVVGRPGHGRFIKRAQHLQPLTGRGVDTVIRIQS